MHVGGRGRGGFSLFNHTVCRPFELFAAWHSPSSARRPPSPPLHLSMSGQEARRGCSTSILPLLPTTTHTQQERARGKADHVAAAEFRAAVAAKERELRALKRVGW